MTVLGMDKMFDNSLQQLPACYRLTVTLLSTLLTAKRVWSGKMWRPQDAPLPPLAFCTNGVCPWGTNCHACSLCIRNTQLIGRQTESVSVWVKQTKWRRQYGIAHTTTQNHLKAITAAAADRQTVRGTGKQAKRAVSRQWALTMNQFTKRNKAAIATGIDKHRQARTKRRQLWKRVQRVQLHFQLQNTHSFGSIFFLFLHFWGLSHALNDATGGGTRATGPAPGPA